MKGIVNPGGSILIGFSGVVRGTSVAGIAGLACAVFSGRPFALLPVYCTTLNDNEPGPIDLGIQIPDPCHLIGTRMVAALRLQEGPMEDSDAVVMHHHNPHRPCDHGFSFLCHAKGDFQHRFPLVEDDQRTQAAGSVQLAGYQEGRGGFSGFTLVDLLIYSPGALLMIYSRERGRTGAAMLRKAIHFPSPGLGR